VRRTIVVGRLTGAFGVRGEIKCIPGPDGAAAFSAGRAYVVGTGESERGVRCRSARRRRDTVLLAFDGFETPEAVRALTGSEIRADVADVPLGADEYLDVDLIGLRLTDDLGHDLDRVVVAVEHYAASDYLIVDPGRKLVPLVKAFVLRIDLAAGTIATALPDGLFD